MTSSERTELKFALPLADLGKLERILEVNCRRVSYRNRTSLVSSLYFDDALLSACRENVDGSGRRSKVRLRWYDAPFPPFPGGELFFEIKRRRGQSTSKERISLLLSLPDRATLQETMRALSRALPLPQLEALLARPEAIVLVEYERSYFEAAGLRITLDRDLVFYSQAGHLRPSRRFPVRVRDIVILEAKGSVGCEDRIREILHPLRPRATRSSKYVLGCQAIGLLGGTHYGEI